MKHNFWTVKLRTLMFYSMILLLIFLLLFHSKDAMDAAKQALVLCYNTVIPSLFPFFILSGLLTAGGFVNLLSRIFSPVMKPVFNISGSGALPFMIGIISGYPMGAKITSELFSDGILSKSEAQRLLPFSNNSGPLFIIGAVGTGMLKNPHLGIFLYAVHVFSSVLVGICFRWYQTKNISRKKSSGCQNAAKLRTSFSSVVSSSIDTMLLICGFIVFFAALSASISPLLDICLPKPLPNLIKPLLEVTGGANLVVQSGLPQRMLLTVLSAIIGFGGICVMLQVSGIAGAVALSMKSYVFGKILHGIFSGLITFFCFPIISTQKDSLLFFTMPANIPVLPILYGITILGVLAVICKNYIYGKT